ncbi:hypothetical protein FKX85_01600 [Echinicola soli]|uniref:Uncharacterized protein n=1 Tax=Echinicola soli TaxID=2591634 RepID=A0A514CDB0_9BACT|nr:hypothetical protein [Echinicola soli]QDH77808.1 hypothetical protein FKX85_01600 [Echinicola soli]
MERQFIERYKRKTRRELQQIINNRADYREEAVRAAEKLLGESDEDPREEISVARTACKRNNPFGPILFARSFSYRDVLTVISSTLLCMALFQILNYYKDEFVFVEYYPFLKLFLFFVFIIINHVLYFKEHKRSNDLLGRSMVDLFFFLSFMLFYSVYEYVVYDSVFPLPLNAQVIVFLAIFTVFSILLFETIVDFIKYLLIKMKCQIF